MTFTPTSSLHWWSDAEPAPALTPRFSADLWDSALTLDAFIERTEVHRDLWQTTRRLARISDEHQSRAAAIGDRLRLVVLLEDWCGDAIHTIPVVARLVEQNPLLDMRVARRDEHTGLMDVHLTGTSRSIPVVIVYGPDEVERGWWGPRPSPLQHWVVTEGLALDATERYRGIRTWYARDRGTTTAAEVLQLLTHR